MSLRGVLCAWMRVWWADRGRAEPRLEGIVCVYVYVRVNVCEYVSVWVGVCVCLCVYACMCVLYYRCSVKL